MPSEMWHYAGTLDPAAASDVHAPGANAAATITLAADANAQHGITGIAYSYNAAPTGGNLILEDASGTTIFSIDITAAGPGFIYFMPPKWGSKNKALIVTLAAGGAAVTGKVNFLGRMKRNA